MILTYAVASLNLVTAISKKSFQNFLVSLPVSLFHVRYFGVINYP